MRPSSQFLPAAVPPAALRAWRRTASRSGGAYETGVITQRFGTGFYLSTPSVPLLPVLGPGALGLPHGILVPGLSASAVAGIQVGDSVTLHIRVGEDRFDGFELRTPGIRMRAVRQWQPAQAPTMAVRTGTASAPTTARCRKVLSLTRPGIARLPELTSTFVANPDAASARALVGLGPGSTPSGDDALCGALLVLRAYGEFDALDRAICAIAGAQPHRRTTALSASLLEAAALGYCLPQVRMALAGVDRLLAGPAAASPSADADADAELCDRADRPDPACRAVDCVAEIGHSSGHDLLVGAVSTAWALHTGAHSVHSLFSTVQSLS